MSTEGLLGPLKALADETRLRLVGLLLTHDLCVGGLAHRLEISEAAVSQHLQVLRKVLLVKGEKRGYWTHYSVEREVLKNVADRLRMLADQSSCTEGCCCRRSSDEIICCRKEVEEDVQVLLRTTPQTQGET